MKKIILCMVLLFATASTAHAILVDITDPTLPHFGDFPHINSPGDYSNISKDFTIDGDNGDFGWHYSPSNHGSSIAGILLYPNTYDVTLLRFEIHHNPFKDFLLQGSTDTVNGFDGNWYTLLASTVTERTELAVQSWDFDNSNFYSAYRIHILNDYTPSGHGWAMYRWELLADNSPIVPVPEPIPPTDDNPVTPTPEPVIPEPATALLLSGGLLGTLFLKKRGNHNGKNISCQIQKDE